MKRNAENESGLYWKTRRSKTERVAKRMKVVVLEDENKTERVVKRMKWVVLEDKKRNRTGGEKKRRE